MYSIKRYFNYIKGDVCKWITDIPYCICESSIANLGKSFSRYFKEKKDGTVDSRIEKMKAAGKWSIRYARMVERGRGGYKADPGYPKFKRRRDDSSFQMRGYKTERDRIWLGKYIGWIRLKERGYIPGGVMYGTGGLVYCTISEKAGRWYISVQVKIDIDVPDNDSVLIIGIDQGLKTRVVCSDGTEYNMPKPFRDAERKISRMQKELKRRTRGGSNWKKTNLKLQKAYQKSANIRKHWLHHISHDIVVNKRPAVIVLETLNVSGMMKNKHISKSVGDAGFYELRRQIEYKAVEYNVKVVLADQWYPSSRLCRDCGLINSDLTLGDRIWTCECGAVHNRDLNAAQNLAALVEP